MLKPIKGELYFDYKCDRCSSVHQVSYAEVLKVGKVLCFCGRLLKFAPFKASLHLNYDYKKPKDLPIQDHKRIHKSKDQSAKVSRDDVVIALGRMGFKKDEAKRIVILNDDGVMSDESLIQRCLLK